ncbi:MAG: hypothetical protein FWC23_04560 [Chitinispirillia bacterium]|nr:hypothetical protein [Chitinispirillia bacterium]MCL2268439.1 hypothetical protein [Chitinispirillia bacterium]
MKNLIEFVKERGMLVMLTGMFTLTAGVICYLAIDHSPRLKSLAYLTYGSVALIALGVVIYIAGRLSVAAERRRVTRQARYGRSLDDKDGDL